MTASWPRWLMTGLGTALLAGLVWWFGPLWPPLEPPLPRVVAVQAVVLVWAVANALLDRRRWARDQVLVAGVSGGEERAAVAQSLRAALARRGRAAVAQLPWYAIIGPPGAGKTTALLNAGLRFPDGAAPVPGVGGTRNCDWWFTEGAVLIDTAGRYTTQDSDQAADRAGWSAFLALLKRTRPAQPLNGVIVAIALPDLLDPAAATHAAAIALRLAELERSFGRALPVYALFTKADLVAGFTEYFDDLDAAGRDQVWGETFTLTEAAPPAERFAAAFHRLARRVGDGMMARIGAERRPDRLLPIAGFPTQFASLAPNLAEFAGRAFAGTTMWRGVYFASGTQEGTPIDRLAGQMSRSFGLPGPRHEAPGAGRSYFLGRLLRDVVFGEAMLVPAPPARRRRRLVLRAVGFAAVALGLAGGAAALFWSAWAAEGQLAPAASQLARYDEAARPAMPDTVTDGDLLPLLPGLDAAQALADAAPAGGVAFGFGQGAKLAAGADALYRNALGFGLLPRLVWQLEADMRGAFPEPDRLYELLRVSLMLGGAGPLDPAAIQTWFARDWARTNPDDPQAGQRLAGHLGRLLADTLPPLELDAALVAAAREMVGRTAPASRVYAALTGSAAARALPPWRPSDSLGLAGAPLFTRASGTALTQGIPGLFTAGGYVAVIQGALPAAVAQVAAETWVLGQAAAPSPAEQRQLERDVLDRYGAEFAARWDAMLADLHVAPIASIPQAAQALYILASPESPLRALLRAIAAPLQLPGDAAPPRYAALVTLGTGDAAPLEHALRLMADIQQQLAKIAALPLGAALPAGGGDIGVALRQDAARLPLPVSRWLSTTADAATALRTGNARRQLALLYNAPDGPAALCAAAVTQYPFAAAGKPLEPAAFARVFGPAGALDGFVSLQLKPYVDTGAEPWKLRPGAPLAAGDLAQFERAAAIRTAFFAAGPTPSFPVTVTLAGPARMAGLTIGGVAVGAGHAAEIIWPPPDPTVELATGGRESGFWALNRVLGRARLGAGPRQGVLRASFGPVAYDFRNAGALSPGLFADFKCPALQ